MTLINFNTSISSIQYDVYKYKLDNKISYNKRRLYKYKVDNKVYDLRTEDNFKFLFNVELDKNHWDTFRNKGMWEYYLSSLNLAELVITHIKGLTKTNKFHTIEFPEEMEDLFEEVTFKLHPHKSTKVLKIKWFSDEFIDPPKEGTLNLAIFHN